VLKSVLNGATLAALPGKVLATGRVQRLKSLASGTDWAALPFSVGFIDPLHSTGIAHSLSGIQRICQALLTTSQSNRAQLLRHYANDLQHEFRHLDQLISGCYDALFDFRVFNCWTMLYFAAATSFESQHRAGKCPSFLLSGDEGFRQVVHRAWNSLDVLSSQPCIVDEMIESFQCEIRDLIEPYNTVGLFAPKHKNMYWHTAAQK
jgi:FADH2 O2-dependent halogenase